MPGKSARRRRRRIRQGQTQKRTREWLGTLAYDFIRSGRDAAVKVFQPAPADPVDPRSLFKAEDWHAMSPLAQAEAEFCASFMTLGTLQGDNVAAWGSPGSDPLTDIRNMMAQYDRPLPKYEDVILIGSSHYLHAQTITDPDERTAYILAHGVRQSLPVQADRGGWMVQGVRIIPTKHAPDGE